jgi:RND family efflux transporter MFP subunit
MNLAKRRGIAWLALVIASIAGGCDKAGQGAAKSTATPPAKVAHVAQEDQLNTIQLTPEAEKRLGIELVPAEMRKVDRVKTLGGEVTLPTGASIIVTAPVGGTLQAPSAGGVPKVGTLVKHNQPIFLLLPLLSPERSVLTPAERIRFAEARNAVAQSRIDADGQVQQARVQVEAAQITLERAERLLREQAGPARAVDDAKAQLSLAQKTLEAALNRKKLVDNIKLDEEAGTLEPLVIPAPQNGIVRAEQAAAGGVVAPGAPLFEVVNYELVWIKVPVYAGELGDVATEKPAEITSIADPAEGPKLTARPIAAPPTATPLASTVDLYYELDNPDSRLRPGERVTARIVLRGDQESLSIPWSAVVHDINGGTWVYESVADHTFVRRRVEVRDVLGSWATLERGVQAGAKIVAAGAIELFGTEFGFAK